MNANSHVLVVKSSTPPIIEFDSNCGAAYIRFKKTRVARTIEQHASCPIITVDLDRQNEVVGIEALFWTEFEIQNILRKAKVSTQGIDFSRAKFRPPARFAEEAVC